MSEVTWELVVGFILTTVFGGAIGYLLKQRSWRIETEHSLHITRYDEGVKFLDKLSVQIGRRYFLLQRYLWSIEDRDERIILDREKEYFETVVDLEPQPRRKVL